MAAADSSGPAPACAPPTTPDIATIRAQFDAIWQEIWDLPGEIGDQRHHAMVLIFDRMSSAVNGTKPLFKDATILDALRRFDSGRAPA